MQSVKIFLIVFVLLSISYAEPDPQLTIPRVELMPNLPLPVLIRDWNQVAVGYDDFVFDFSATGQYLPLIKWDSTYQINGEPTFSLPSYVGGNHSSGEAINTMAAVISASLVGIDKQNQNGLNWVAMCQKYFAVNGSATYTNNPGSGWGSSFWYDILPDILFFQLFDLYPDQTDFPYQFASVLNQWYAASAAMGDGPGTIPDYNYTYFDFQSMQPQYNGYWREPDAAAGIAWLEYLGWTKTGNPQFLEAAEWGITYLHNHSQNPLYEILLPYGAYTAARMNAELGTDYDVSKLVNWCFGPSDARPGWGVVTGNWNGYECGGLAGSITDSDGYAFAMGTFETAGALAPLVRYDNRFAKSIGKWLLNAINASRLYYSNGLPAQNQDCEDWSWTNDPGAVISYEGLRHEWQGVSPLATGDALRSGWAPSNFALYGASHVGIFGALVDTTNVPGILKIDLLATDYMGEDAFPSYLIYNPYSEQRTISLTVGPDTTSIYDAVANSFIEYGFSGTDSLTIPGDSVRVLVLVPASSTIRTQDYALLADNIVIDFHYSIVPDTTNRSPIITDFSADTSVLSLGEQTSLICQAYDPDDDPLTYTWTATGGTLTPDDINAVWQASDQEGVYIISCRVCDSLDNCTTAGLNITVLDTVNQNYPELVAQYLFNGNAIDVTGHGHDGIVSGPVPVEDRFGNPAAAYWFDGNIDRIQISNSSDLNFQEALTVTFWMKPSEIPDFGTETYPISHGSWEERWKYSFMGNRRIRWTVNTENAIVDLDCSSPLDTVSYYFISGTYDGSRIKLYINGQLERNSALTGLINQSSLDLTIGQQKPAVTQYNYRGFLDDIRIYSVALTDSAITALYFTELSIAEENQLPDGFHLAHNYPNPFNPATTINFSLPVPTHVKLSILNLVGQTVAMPVNADFQGGNHTVRWDASGFASGVYFYRIDTKEFSDIKKCIILK